jgi:hypothetical protein
MKWRTIFIFICFGLGVAYLSVSREPQSPHDQNTINVKGVSFSQKIASVMERTFSKNDDEIVRIKEEIAAREGVLKDMEKALPGIIDQANNVQPLCSTGSVSVGEIDDPRSQIRGEISQLKQRLASFEK